MTFFIPFGLRLFFYTAENKPHVDCRIADALLKKGTKQHTDGWDTSRKDWVHMVLHLPHAEGGFGVPFNCVTKDDAFYTSTSQTFTPNFLANTAAKKRSVRSLNHRLT